ncbi:TPA: hypothetical protein HA238_02935 [Candidatus Micrarchaeota archaeon]|nr:hypothetical protein [Candidatus Micrarchaeota archaeon]
MDINQAFKFTYKLLLGECNVEMDEVKDWLLSYQVPLGHKTSSVSGKPVVVSSQSYPDDAKFISQDEIDWNNKFEPHETRDPKPGTQFEPLGINEIKDLDSIVEAIQNRVAYTGNKTFGRSEQIENSDNCVDSFCVKDSHNIHGSKYVAYSSYMRDGAEYTFGCAYSPSSKYAIHVIEGTLIRAFESYFSASVSDVYCSYYNFDCAHLMFSFNQKGKRYCIGNLELPRERYLQLKDKLVVEIREYIEKHKRFYPPFAIPGMPKAQVMPKFAFKQPEQDFNKIDAAFKDTCRVIFGKEIGGLKENQKFLTHGINSVESHPTSFGNTVWFSPSFTFFGSVPKDRTISCHESEHASNLKMELSEGEDISLESLAKKLAGIAFFPTNVTEGNSVNNIESHVTYCVANSYQVSDCAHSKNCAYCNMAVASENVFGCKRAVHSKFSIRLHGCTNMTACLEMEGCNNCANSMFCHNSENLDNCMFCFNTKSKRYAIGNVEVGREKYMEVKKVVMDELLKRLEARKGLGLDIYNLGSV